MKKILIIAALVISAAGLRADESHGFQASLTPDIAIYPKTTEIRGLSLNIWGENPQHGVALGFVNGSTGDSSGFSWAFFYNYADTYTGVEWAHGELQQDQLHRLAGGLGQLLGRQVSTGLQMAALVNYAENLHGVQIGLANIAMNNGWFNDFPDKLATGFPIVNWSF